MHCCARGAAREPQRGAARRSGRARVPSQVLRVLVKLYEQAAAGTDYVSVCQCLMFLDDAPAAAALLERLIDGSEARPRQP